MLRWKLIYEYVFCPAILKYGLSPKYWKRASTQNVIESFWPELNSRVNYPVKRALISIIEENDYSMLDPVLKYYVSWITNYICQDGTQHLIKSWNHHRTPGPMGCIPTKNMRLSQQNARSNKVFVQSTSEAVKMYEESSGNLSRNSSFGWDPSVMNEETYEHRLRYFLANQPTGEAIFADIVHGYNETLKISIEYFHNLATSL